MNSIEQLRDDLKGRFPNVALEIDAPANADHSWLLDIGNPGEPGWIVVEWKPGPGFGFGVSTPDEADFGTKPDEVYPTMPLAYERVVQILDIGPDPVPVRLTRIEARPGSGLID